MKKILIVYAHPNYANSRMNRALISAVERAQHEGELTQIRVHNLYEQYQDRKINVAQEQNLLLEADLIILQFPFYWFSTTPLMKQWLDEVFLTGFAYGPEGDKLHGKDLMLCITTGGSKDRYAKTTGFTLPELLKPFEYTARYCNLIYHAPFLVDGYDMPQAVLSERAKQYVAFLKSYQQEGCRVFIDLDYPSFA